jgi:hypothetical protein
MLVFKVYFGNLIPKSHNKLWTYYLQRSATEHWSTCQCIRCLHNLLNVLVQIANKMVLQRKKWRVLLIVPERVFVHWKAIASYTVPAKLCQYASSDDHCRTLSLLFQKWFLFHFLSYSNSSYLLPLLEGYARVDSRISGSQPLASTSAAQGCTNFN